MKKFASLLLAFAMTVGMLTGCGGDSGTSSTGEAPAQEVTVAISSTFATLDPALISTTHMAHVYGNMGSNFYRTDANGVLQYDLGESMEKSEDGLTYTFTIKEGLKWSDGEPLTAEHFVYGIKRAIGYGPDNAYTKKNLVNFIAGAEEAANAAMDVADMTNVGVTALDDTTFQVELKAPASYFITLTASTAFMPVCKANVEKYGEDWSSSPETYVCNGPYTMESWEHNSVITLVKNPNFYDADEITMETINFYLSDDVNNMLSNFKNGDWELIDDVPTNEIASLKAEYPDEFVVAGQIGTYYVCWNINEDILPASSTLTGAEAEQAKAEIRNAIGLLFDRNYIVEEIGQAGQIPASSFVAMGMTNPDGTQFYETAGHSDDYVGYYDVSADAYESNFESAVETLKKYYTYDESTGMFTDFPTLTYLYNTSEAHKAIGEYLQSAMAAVGITMNLENQEWATFLNTRKAGDYSIARNGWVADYNDPICFLDMWVTNSGNNDVQFGKGNAADAKVYSLDLTSYGYDTKVENGTWAETYDVLISDIKSCTDPETRYALMHEAEDLLMSTGCIVPLYYYTDIYMLDSNIHGFFSNPLGYKYFMYCTIG